jgi:hypothetical protein
MNRYNGGACFLSARYAFDRLFGMARYKVTESGVEMAEYCTFLAA